MGVDGVRIFIAGRFFKGPGKGHTPWHQDATCLVMVPGHMVTAWVPLVPLTSNGRQRLVDGSHQVESADLFGVWQRRVLLSSGVDNRCPGGSTHGS